MQRLFDTLPNPLGSKVDYRTGHGVPLREDHSNLLHKAWQYVSGANVKNLDKFTSGNQEAEFGYRKLSPEEEEYIIRVHHYEQAQADGNVDEDVLHRVQQKMEDAYNAVKQQSEHVVHQAGGTVQSAYESTKDRLGNAVENIKDTLGHISESAQEKMRKASEKAPEYAQEAYDKGAEYAQDTIDKGSDYAREAYDRGSEYSKNAYDKGANMAKEAYDKSKHYADAAYDKASDYGHEALNKGDKYARDTASQAKNIGERLGGYFPSRERLSELGRKVTPDFLQRQDSASHYGERIRAAFDPSRYHLRVNSPFTNNLIGSGNTGTSFMPVTGFYGSLITLYFCVLFYRAFSRSLLVRRRNSQRPLPAGDSDQSASRPREEDEDTSKKLGSGLIAKSTLGLDSTHFLSSTVAFPLAIMLLGYLELTGSSRLLLNSLYIIFLGGWILRTDVLPLHPASPSNAYSPVSDYGFYSTIGVLSCAAVLGVWHSLNCQSIF